MPTLKTYACTPKSSRGRLYQEKDIFCNHSEKNISEFKIDKDRIIRSNAFRRLQHKTQVLASNESDHYRNRMTHSIEVASIARFICESLSVCAYLAESISLAHDLGHTPFGHAGEEVLNDCMKDFGGFSHNVHTFKILTQIEVLHPYYYGLNLTWEVLEGIIKHNGPVIKKIPSYHYIFDYNSKYNLELDKYSSIEAQVAAIADDIAYICHDLEDGVNFGFIDIKELENINVIDKYIFKLQKSYKNISKIELIRLVCSQLVQYFIDNVISQTNINIKNCEIITQDDVRELKKRVVELDSTVFTELTEIKSFLYKKFYKHDSVKMSNLQGQEIIRELFYLYANDTKLLPLEWQNTIISCNEPDRMSIIADYIAGMTDRFAVAEHEIHVR